MKGTIVRCIEEMVKQRFGEASWKECLKKAGQPEGRIFTAMADVPDQEIMAIMQAAGSTLKLTMPQVMDAFGEHWSHVYAPAMYGVYFSKAKSMRELLLNLDEIHKSTTRSVPGAHPPGFTYEWRDDRHLVMHYKSGRGLVALMPGLVKGLAKHYSDHVSVSVTGSDVHVQFQ